MKKLSSKIMAIFLLLLLVAVAGVGAVILIQLQNDQAPVDTSASGFGPTATKNLYRPMEEAFNEANCDTFFSNELIDAQTELVLLPDLHFYAAKTPDFASDIALTCTYYISTEKFISMYVYAYDDSSVIANSLGDLMHSNDASFISEVVETSKVSDFIHYSFGTDVYFPENCRTTIYHEQNDFELITLRYSGWGGCTELKDFNKEVVTVFGKTVDELVASVTSANQPTNITPTDTTETTEESTL